MKATLAQSANNSPWCGMAPVSNVRLVAQQAAVHNDKDIGMSIALREQGIETVHDQVVSLVAQRWAKAFVCKVTIRTSLEQNPWADPLQQCDIVRITSYNVCYTKLLRT